MTKNGINLQDSFLNQVRKDNAQVEMTLLDGSRLNGQVRGFDNFTVIIQSDRSQHLVYKHAIAQIIHQPRGDFRPYEREAHPPRPAEAPHPPRHQPQPSRPVESRAEHNKFNAIDLADVKVD